MADQNFNSENIDDYTRFDFRNLGNNEIEVSEQQYRSFPLSNISQKDGFLHIEVYYEVYMWDHWIRNYSIKKLEKSFFNVFKDLQIEGVDDVKAGTFDEEEDYVLVTWHLKMPLVGQQNVIKTTILKSVDIILYKTRLQLEENKSPTGLRKYFVVNGNSYTIGTGIFWVVLPIICGFAFFLGTIKYDAEKINLSEQKKELEDTVKSQENTIKYIRHNSDSALNILGHMPYNEMKLDTQAFRKVQTTIENAGAALYLNK